MQNQSKQRAGLFKLIPVRKSFAGPQPLPSEKVIRARNLTMRKSFNIIFGNNKIFLRKLHFILAIRFAKTINFIRGD